MLAHLDDLASDFSAIHRVDMYALPGPVFFRFAFRLGAYQGVIQARMAEQSQEQAPAASNGRQASAQREVNPGTKVALQADPAFAGIFSFA